MSLRIEHVLVERQNVRSTEQQVQVLECLAEPERFHPVFVLDGYLVDVAHTGVSTRYQFAMLLECLEDLPSLSNELSNEAVSQSVSQRCARANRNREKRDGSFAL